MHEPSTHPHRLHANGVSPARRQTLASLRDSLGALEGDALACALTIANAVEWLASGDLDEARDALDRAAAELRELA
jgi:DNA recombination-dependent growth factor C